MSWRGISRSESTMPPAAGPDAIAARWQIAKETAAKVTVDLDREVETKFRSSSKTRILGVIEPVLGVKRFHCESCAWQCPRIKSQSPHRVFCFLAGESVAKTE